MKTLIIKIISLMMVIVLIFSNLVFAQTVPAQTIIISEIGAHEKTDYEWIEIYNISNTDIDLTDWKFYEENTNHGLKEFQNDLIISPDEYAVIADVPENFLETHPYYAGTLIDSSWTSLKLTGEEIELKNSQDEIIEKFIYPEVNTTSLQKIDLTLNDYTSQNWESHETNDTAGNQNEFTEIKMQNNLEPVIDNSTALQDTTTTFVQSILLGEILLNEIVSDAESGEKEWVEIFNTTSRTINLNGLSLQEGSGVKNKLKGEILANSYYVYEFSRAKLNNKGDEVILLDANDNELDYFSYGDWNEEGLIEAPKEKYSLARNSENNWLITNKKTPNKLNLFNEIDNSSVNEVSKILKEETKPSIIFNELFPNPIGSDRFYEFIELKNISEQSIDISSWVIKDKSELRFILPKMELQKGQIVTFERNITNITLDNDNEEVQLLDNTGKTIDKVKYSNLTFEENYSYQKIDNEWKLTAQPTKNQENVYYPINEKPIIKLYCENTVSIGENINCDASDSYDPNGESLIFNWELLDKDNKVIKNDFADIFNYKIDNPDVKNLSVTVSDRKNKITKVIKLKITNALTIPIEKPEKLIEVNDKEKIIIAKELDDVKELENGTLVVAKGTVSVLPGTFGKNYIFLSGSGMQITNDSGDWPNLQEGDYIEVTGKVGETNGQKIIKITNTSNIDILQNNEPPIPKEITISNIGEKYESYLIQITGRVEDITNNSFKLIDDKNNQAQIYIKRNTGISTKSLMQGEEYRVVGIITQQKDVYEIFPRTQEDIKQINDSTNNQLNEETDKVVENYISTNNESGSVIKILGITILTLIIILVVIIRLRTLAPTPLKTRVKVVGNPLKKDLINK